MELAEWTSAVTALVSILGFVYNVLQGRKLTKEKVFRQVLMSHLCVAREYNSLKRKALKYSRNLRDVYFLIALFINVLVYYSLYSIRKLALLFLIIVIWGTILNTVFILIKKALVSEARLNENDVKKNLKGSAGIFLLSAILFMNIVLLMPNSPVYSFFQNQTTETSSMHHVSNFSSTLYSGSTLVAGVGVLLSALLFSDIVDKGTSLLWKIQVATYDNSKERVSRAFLIFL